MNPVAKRGVLSLVVFVLASVVLAGGRANAQTVSNPKLVQFTASPDHYAVLADGRPIIDHYSLSVSQVSASRPFYVLDIGKPTPDADGAIRYDFSSTVSSWPLPGGDYLATVDAVGPAGTGVSAPSNAFNFGCWYSLGSVSASFGSAADSGSVSVSTQPGCTWSAVSNVSWVTMGTRSGTGSGTATYSLSANTGTLARTGALTIAGTSYTITQAAASTCSYALSSSSNSFTAAGGSGTVGITTPSGCAWSATADVVWITVTTGGGVGNGTAVYTVSPNAGGSSRTGVLTIGGLRYTVTQSGTTTGTTALPSPWATQDIGSCGLTGSVSYSSGVFTVKGAGSDIWGTNDSFRFVYQPLAGDGQIVARIASLTNTNPNAKAGVMLRQSLSEGSAHVILDLQPGADVEFMRRASANSSTSYLAGTAQSAPAWLRLARSGSTITGSVSSDGRTWRTVGTTSLSMTGTIYVGLVVTSHNTSSFNAAVFDGVAISGAQASVLPAPWANQDIGAAGLAGSATYNAGVFTVKGAGEDIWGTADAFHFVQQPLVGDGQIVARVTGITNTHMYAKAGVMLRESLSAESKNVILDLVPNGGIEFMGRAETPGWTAYLSGDTQSAPVWLRLARTGSTITGSISTDGASWRTVGTTTLTMAATIYAGLAVSSHTTSALNTATFDQVTVR